MTRQVLSIVLILTTLVGTSRADELQHIVNSLIGVKRHLFERKDPKGRESDSIERVADELDYLEHQIETYGSIVPKQPDIWGEARLTQQRRQYEVELAKRFDEARFDQGMQASIRRADLSFLAASFAIGAAAGDGSGVAATPPVTAPDLTGQGLSAFNATPSDRLLSTRTTAAPTLSVEPAVEIAQLSRYLKFINQLRRINEGDDTADAPGYALNLMRIPVSVLPGKRTRDGYGAEITFTADPFLSDDLLPTTVENLIVNDLVDEFTQPMARFANNDPTLAKLIVDNYPGAQDRVLRWMFLFDQYIYYLEQSGRAEAAYYMTTYRDFAQARLLGIALMARYVELEREGKIPTVVAQSYFPKDSGYYEVPTPPSPDPTDDQNGATALLSYAAIANLFDAAFQDALATYNTELKYEPYFLTEKKTTLDVSVELQVKSETEPEVVATGQYQLSFNFLNADSLDRLLSSRDLTVDGVYPFSIQFAPPEPARIEEVSQGRSPRILKQIGYMAPAAIEQFQEKAADTFRKQGLSEEDAKSAAQRVRDFKERMDNFYGPAPLIDVPVNVPPNGDPMPNVDVPPPADDYIRSNRDLTQPILQATGAIAISLPPQLKAMANVVPVRTQNAQLPVPPSQFFDVFGLLQLGDIATAGYDVLQVQPANDPLIHIFDIRQYFKEELKATYDLMKTPQYAELWSICDSELYRAIRTANDGEISRLRHRFHLLLQTIEATPRNGIGPTNTIRESLAWAILVDAALVDQRLAEDMQHVAQTRGCGCLVSEGMCFVRPQPMLSQEAIEAFKQYVLCKWPIYIFTLDPITDDQNVSDFLDRRRELQLAVAAAVASGEMNASGALRFQRQMETEIETIALNRRIVSFSHGTNTFGWRFYPRVQTPDSPGNLVAFGQTLFGGPSQESDMRKRQLEPEMRELTAIVIMPSFVPTLTLESRANWFSLTNPRCKQLTLNDTMKMSRTYQTIRNRMDATCNNGCYRPLDVAQLSGVLDQMEERLPLQQKLVGIPHENTLGAFDLFDSGVTSLGPELTGWYGAPGIDPNGSTTLFFTGRNFSVLESDLIVGGREARYELLSREVMKVTIPPGVQTLADERFGHFVDAHLATPYGPSSHLLIPLNQRTFAAGDRFLWATSNLQIDLFYNGSGSSAQSQFIRSNAPPILKLRTPTLGMPTTLPVSLAFHSDNRLLYTTSVFATLDVRSQQYVIGDDNFQDFANALRIAANNRFDRVGPSPDSQINFSVNATIQVPGSIPDPVLIPMNLDVTLKLQQ